MRTITTVFEEVTRSQNVKTFCKKCDKKLTRLAKITNTINPFNKNADGIPRNRSEVTIDVKDQLSLAVGYFAGRYDGLDKCYNQRQASHEGDR